MNKSLFQQFLKACEDKNIHLLKDDINFISKTLILIPYKLHKDVLRHYISKWMSGIKNSGSPNIAPNSGRRKANKWLCEYMINQRKNK